MRKKMRHDKAQMMVLESIIFAITVVIALVFLIQLAPTSIQSSIGSSINLKILGDDALDTAYTETSNIRNAELIEPMKVAYTTNNPSNKLVVSLITNNYSLLIDETLNKILPANVLYNIYISNGTNKTFWCSYTGDPNDLPQSPFGEDVFVSHKIIAIDPVHLTSYGNNSDGTSDIYHIGKHYGDRSDLCHYFLYTTNPYDGSTYDVILEMWRSS
jgi:hypothetical protein